MKNLSIGILNDLYGNRLTEKQRNVIRSYYDYDLSVSEIAEGEGITRQAVFDALKKGEKILLDCEKQSGVLEERMRMKSILETARKALDDGDAVTAQAAVSDALKLLE